MAYSYALYDGDGATAVFPVNMPYIAQAHIKVLVDGVETPFEWLNTGAVRLEQAPATGSTVKIKRETPRCKSLVDFQNGTVLTESEMDLSTLQMLYIVQETYDSLTSILQTDERGNFNGQGKLISNVADPIAPQDVATRHWVETAPETNISQAVDAKNAAEVYRNEAEALRDETVVIRDAAYSETGRAIAEALTSVYTKDEVYAKNETYNKSEVDVLIGELPRSMPHAPQSIVRAVTGERPGLWGPEDCDAPVQSMSAESAVIVNNDVLPVFSGSNSSGGMAVSAKSIYNGNYPVWKAFNKQSVNYLDSWQSGNDFASGTGVGNSWIQADMGGQVNVARIVLYPRNEDGKFNTNFPYDFDIVIDGVKVKEVRDAIPPSRTARMEFDLDSPVTGQIVRLDITRTGGASVTSLGQFYVYDAEVVSGSALVQIAAGLQVAYADSGIVKLSEVLYSAHVLDLSAAADGGHYVYADIDEDGTFSGFGHTAATPMVGTERSGAGDLYNPVTVTMYDTNDNPIRRVYLGWVEKFGGTVTDVHCYSLGTVVTMPINSGNPVATLSLVLDELPYAYSRMMQVEPQLYGEGIWGKAGWIYTSAGLGVSATVRKEAIRVVTGTGLTAQYASIGGDFNANIPSPAKIRVTVYRGY
jgi:hypothetical protein